MILLTVFLLLMSIDFACEAWKVGMRQLGAVTGLCALLGFGGVLFTMSALLLIPFAGFLLFGSIALHQMRKYQVGRYKPRPLRK